MSSSKGFYLWWVAQRGRPPIAGDTHVFQLCHRAWDLRRDIDVLDDPEAIRLTREAWDDAAAHMRTQDTSDEVRPELRSRPRSGTFQFVWWGWGKWKNLGRLGPWPNTPHRPNHHGCIYSWRFNLGVLEIRRWT